MFNEATKSQNISPDLYAFGDRLIAGPLSNFNAHASLEGLSPEYIAGLKQREEGLIRGVRYSRKGNGDGMQPMIITARTLTGRETKKLSSLLREEGVDFLYAIG